MLGSGVCPVLLNAIAAFSEECVEKLVISVATLLSSQLCIRTLTIGSCKSEKRAARLNTALMQPLINLRLCTFGS